MSVILSDLKSAPVEEVMASPRKFSMFMYCVFLSTLFGETIENRELLYVKYCGWLIKLHIKP